MTVSPLAPAAFPDLPSIAGVTFAAAAAGVKYKNRVDVMLALLAPGSAVAGVFTRSSTRSAPVLDCQAKLGGDANNGAAILVNSGNSNAFTGGRGVESVKAVTQAVAAETGIPEARVFTASTGVIGEPLPHDRIIAKIAELNANQSEAGIADAARAIMTTDTFPKGAMAEVEVAGKTVKINSSSVKPLRSNLCAEESNSGDRHRGVSTPCFRKNRCLSRSNCANAPDKACN